MSKITDIRTYLMGIAILWVMISHTKGIWVLPKFIECIQKTGYLGVDIFFFVSAYGLFYSMKKHLPMKQWYMRRFNRVLPKYWIVTIFTGMMIHWGLSDYIKEVTFVGFLCPWVNHEPLFWYIPAAVLFYIVFPMFYQYRRPLTMGFIPISVIMYVLSALLLCITREHGLAPYLPEFFLPRIPVFLLGMILAEYEEFIGQRMNVCTTALLVCVSFAAFVLLELHAMYETNFLSFFNIASILLLCSLPFILYLCGILYKYVRILNPFVLYCGKYSLELYLLHYAFECVVIRSGLFVNINPNYTFLSAFVLSFPCAFLLNKIVTIK